MGDKAAGLLPKYNVTRTDGKPIGFCFVLEPGRDPFAVDALELYAIAASEGGYKALGKELAAIARQYRAKICHDCGWTGNPEQMGVRRGKRATCPQCQSENVHKKVVEAEAAINRPS